MGHLAMESDTTGMGFTGGGTAAAAKAAGVPKPRAKRPAAAQKPVVISDSEDDASGSGGDSDLQLDDDDRYFPCGLSRDSGGRDERLLSEAQYILRLQYGAAARIMKTSLHQSAPPV